MTCTTGHAALLRKLYRSLSPNEWIRFCQFHRQIKFDGEHFGTLSLEQLATLSTWASKAR